MVTKIVIFVALAMCVTIIAFSINEIERINNKENK